MFTTRSALCSRWQLSPLLLSINHSFLEPHDKQIRVGCDVTFMFPLYCRLYQLLSVRIRDLTHSLPFVSDVSYLFIYAFIYCAMWVMKKTCSDTLCVIFLTVQREDSLSLSLSFLAIINTEAWMSVCGWMLMWEREVARAWATEREGDNKRQWNEMAWNGTEKDQNLGMHEMEQKGNAEVIK